MAWDPAQYLKFAGPRLRPAIDLLGHIEAEAPRLVYDLGCGAGNVTRFIAERWPAVAYLDGRGGAHGAVARETRTAAAPLASRAARFLLQSFGAARREARHLGDR